MRYEFELISTESTVSNSSKGGHPLAVPVGGSRLFAAQGLVDALLEQALRLRATRAHLPVQWVQMALWAWLDHVAVEVGLVDPLEAARIRALGVEEAAALLHQAGRGAHFNRVWERYRHLARVAVRAVVVDVGTRAEAFPRRAEAKARPGRWSLLSQLRRPRGGGPRRCRARSGGA